MNQSYDWDRAPFNDTVFLHVQMPFRRSVYLLSNPFRTSNFSYSNVILRDHDVIVFFINLLAYSLCIHLIGCFFVFWLPLFFFPHHSVLWSSFPLGVFRMLSSPRSLSLSLSLFLISKEVLHHCSSHLFCVHVHLRFPTNGE